MSYDPDSVHEYQRAAVYVDKILKGANPADLPVQQPISFELVINLKTAKQIAELRSRRSCWHGRIGLLGDFRF